MDAKTPFCLSLLLFCFIPSLHAAELAGRIWYEHNKRPANNLNIGVQCPDGARHTGKTDNYGFYRCTGIPANKQSCYIFIDDGKRHADPLLYDSGQGRDTQNFSVLPNDNKLIIRKY